MPTNPLTEILPTKARKILYAVLFVAALGFAAWQAADGDWTAFAGGLITALFGATAASNTGTSSEDGGGDLGFMLLVLAVVGIGLLLLGVKFG
jgi:TRAP-type C4-dicarboxylate transport system permease small subunit